MAIGFVILTALSLAMAVFAIAVKKGANVVVLDAALFESGLIAGAVEIAAAAVGYGIGRLILSREMTAQHSLFWVHLLAGFMLAAIGIRMLLQGFQKQTIWEHRMQKIDMKSDAAAFLRVCANAGVVGIAFGLMRVNLLLMLAITFLTTIAGVMLGYYGGRAFGGESGNKVCAVGGGILCIVGICLQIIG